MIAKRKAWGMTGRAEHTESALPWSMAKAGAQSGPEDTAGPFGGEAISGWPFRVCPAVGWLRERRRWRPAP